MENNKIYHHIGIRRLYEFVVDSEFILNNELKKFALQNQSKIIEPETVDLFNDNIVEIK